MAAISESNPLEFMQKPSALQACTERVLQASKRSEMSASSITIGKKPSSILVTDAAVQKIHQLLAQEDESNSLFLRVSVRPGGCSGFSYDMFFDSEISEGDIESNFGDVKVVVDEASVTMLKGATLDYRDGLQDTGFHITNPNASRTCGCGSSFS